MERLRSRSSRWWLPVGGLMLVAWPCVVGGTSDQPRNSPEIPDRRPVVVAMPVSYAPATTQPGGLTAVLRDAGRQAVAMPWQRQLRVTVGPARPIRTDEASMPTPPRMLQPPEASALPPSVPLVRSVESERNARGAEQRIRHGIALGCVGAHFAARAEFIAALRLVARGLDVESGRAAHGCALAAGITAMKEADDFSPTGSCVDIDPRIAELVDGHRTPVLKATRTGDPAPGATLASDAALDCYLDFAAQQLAEAVGQEAVGSAALHALGRTYEILAREQSPAIRAADRKAIALHRAATMVCSDDCGSGGISAMPPSAERAIEYRLRVDDVLEMTYRLTREETSTPYRLGVGDVIRVESCTNKGPACDAIVQPDGTITLRLLGQVPASGRSIAGLTKQLEQAYRKYYKVPAITVTPLKVNTKLEDLRAAVAGRRYVVGVSPEGTIVLPMLGSVNARGLTLRELGLELNERYRYRIEGVEVTVAVVRQAPRFIYVLGEVARPGRFEQVGPTSVLQAIAMAGGWNAGAHLKQTVILRRDRDCRPTMIFVDLRHAQRGDQPCLAGEVGLHDNDVVIVPGGPVRKTEGFLKSVFSRGSHRLLPQRHLGCFANPATEFEHALAARCVGCVDFAASLGIWASSATIDGLAVR